MHLTVLLHEAVEGLAVRGDGLYVDVTFGRGGHSREILKQLGAKGKLLVIDQDPQAIAEAEKLAQQDERVVFRHGRFDQLGDMLSELGWQKKVNGILADLGVSSPQLDQAERGFSFLRDGPLDMRMNPQQQMSAADWLHSVEEKEIVRVLKVYGEERFAKRIAHAICERRAEQRIETTAELAELIDKAVPRREPGKHPATRSFQAIRIAVNDELGALERFLPQALEALAVGGRLSVISFHSLEDRMVKRFIRKEAKGDEFPADFPITQDQLNIRVKAIGKAIKASRAEVEQNPRSRSAVLRVAEKCA